MRVLLFILFINVLRKRDVTVQVMITLTFRLTRHADIQQSPGHSPIKTTIKTKPIYLFIFANNSSNNNK